MSAADALCIRDCAACGAPLIGDGPCSACRDPLYRELMAEGFIGYERTDDSVTTCTYIARRDYTPRMGERLRETAEGIIGTYLPIRTGEVRARDDKTSVIVTVEVPIS